MAALLVAAVPALAQSNENSSSNDQDSVYYPNCTAARAAGAAPIYVGQPGYRAKLDRDRDGIACE